MSGLPWFTREDVDDLHELHKQVFLVSRSMLAEDPKNIFAKHLYDVVQRSKGFRRRIEALLPPESHEKLMGDE